MHVQINIQYIKKCINPTCPYVLDCWVEEDDNMAMLEDDDNMAGFHSYPGSTSIMAQILDQ